MPLFNSNVYKGREARDMLKRGADMVADAVKPTLGSRGSNAILQEDLYPFHIVTNDGISIAQKVQSSHPVETIGINIMKEISDRANRESGDGTTTAMTLTQAILTEGMATEQSGMEIKRSLDECLPIIYASLDAQAKQITPDDVYAVANISGEDQTLAQSLADIYKAIGKDGIVEIDASGTFDTKVTITDGVKLRNCGYMAHYMANQGSSAVYKNPYILVCKQRISTLADIDPLFQEISGKGVNELVLFVDDIDPAVANALAFTHQKAIFRTLIIKAPILWKDWLFEDLAKITGATIVEPSSGLTFKALRMSHLGTCEKLTTSKTDTVVVGIKDISEHIKMLEERNDEDSKLRLAWLKTKAATLFLGASSESELSYKRLKAEDARNASYLALQGGVVPGGGVALKNASEGLPDTIGGKVLKIALKAPISQIIANAGVSGIPEMLGSEGFDATTRTVVDMWEAKIIDPLRVVKNSIKNAVSVAGTVLTAETIVIKPKV